MKGNIRGFICAFLMGILIVELWLMDCGEVCAGEFDESLYATAAVLMDASSGRVLYGKNADTPMAMASTTKIMTCILVLELGNQEDVLQVSAYAASMPKVKLYIRQGESYRVGDLLYSLMLESHNDSAVALAEYVGSRYLEGELKNKPVAEYTVEESKMAVAAFAAQMNAKARELGCEHTWFITPNGLDATETLPDEKGESVVREHCTTAAELARIMSYCILESPKKEAFLQITQTPHYSFEANGRSFSCNNHNAFLTMMSGAISGKTGFTNKAGYCYVGALQRDGRTFVVALLACGWPNNKNYKWSDTRKLMEYGMEEYFYRSFLAEGVAFDERKLQDIEVLGGTPERLGEAAYTGLAIRRSAEGDKMGADGLLMREDEQVTVECEMEKRLMAPVKKETVVGHIYYKVGEANYRTETIVTTGDVPEIDLSWCLAQVLSRYLLK